MKTLQKLICLFLLILCAGMLALPVAASSYAEYDGLQVSVEMDKEQYEEGEPITATISVTNTNAYSVTIVSLEQLIPEGYVLAEDSEVSMQNVEMQSGQTIVLQVTFVGEPVETVEGDGESGSFWDKLLYGETWGIPNILLLVIGLIAFAIYMFLT